ncbi:MAG: BatD family protein [Candidatus Poribacteria bacterium]|nr:BatD family protein [Candidatus Poribacteria bacterium]
MKTNYKYKLLRFLTVFFIGTPFLQNPTAIAEQIAVSASVDRKIVPVGGKIQLTVEVDGIQSINPPELPDMEGFQSRYQGPNSQISIVNGQISASIKHRYGLTALKVGKYTINSIEVTYKGKNYRTEPITVEVIKRAAAQRKKGGPEGDELKDRIYLTLTAAKEKVYLNEAFPITVRLYHRQIEVREIEYPTLLTSAFSVRGFTEPSRTEEVIDGVRFYCLNFETVVYPVSTGQLTLGPAQLKCSLVLKEQSRRRNSLFDDEMFFNQSSFDDFFGRAEKRAIVLKSEPLRITVGAHPQDGKPRDFSGAVGQYTLQVEAKPREVKVGEPITLTMHVTGRGNIETVSLPQIYGLDRFKTYNPQIKTGEHGKSFEQVLIPEDESIEAIPEIRFSYFDPEREKYHTIKKGEIPIHVTAIAGEEGLKIVDLPGAEKTVKREKLGRDILYIKDSMKGVQRGNTYLYQNGLFLFAQTLPLIAFVGVLIYQKRKDKLTGDIIYARRRQAPRKAKKGLDAARKLAGAGQTGAFCEIIFRTMQEYIGDLFAYPAAGITSEVVEELRKHGVTEDALEKLRALFESCDSVRYASEEISRAQMQRLLTLTEEAMNLLSESST